MLNRASQEGAFSAQSAKHMVLATAQDGNDPPKATVSKPFWARKRRHAHGDGKNRVVKMCSLPRRGAHFHNFRKKVRKNVPRGIRNENNIRNLKRWQK